jgi:hypothetical protein
MTPFGSYSFESRELLWAQQHMPFLRPAPVPVPYPYLQGLDLVKYRDETGKGFGKVYLLGETRPDGEGGFKGYFLVASLFKVPIVTQILIATALVVFVSRRRSGKFAEREAFLLVPAAVFALYFNLLVSAQIGIRLYLVVFPFLIVFASGALRDWSKFGIGRRALSYAALALLIASVASYYPNYIPYFNELAGDRLMTFRLLADSNIDYGQARIYVDRYRAAHPEAALEPSVPTAGEVIVEVNHLTGVTTGPPWLRWLRENLHPVGDIAHAYLIYQVPTDLLSEIH